MSVKDNYPNLKPSLLLAFSDTKTLDPRITYSRASTATYYDGKTTAKAEENLLEQSEAFDSGLWTKLSLSVTANTETAPNGTTTADTLTASAGTVRPYVVANNPTGKTVAGQLFVGSVFAKKGTHNFLQIAVNAQATDYANFNLDTGVVGTTGGTVTSSISSVGNGWYRCVLIYTPAGTINVPTFEMAASASATRGQSWTAAGTETIILWGAQLEQRSSVTAYTPTTTQPITNYIPVLQTAAANVARFDHNPVTRESLGLLVEEQRTNLLTYSSQFDDAAWGKSDVSITANTIVAPDGTLTGDKVVENTATASHFITSNATPTSGSPQVFSVYAKAAERTRISLTGAGFTGQGFQAIFDLATGTMAVNVGNKGSITSVGNGWYRCSIAFTPSNTVSYQIQLADASGNITYTGNGFNGVYIWGAQLEAGAFPTSYIATSASQVTRAADSASMTGTNFSSWFNNAEGTVYLETRSSKGSFPTSYSFYSSDSNFIRLNKTSATSTEATNYELRVSSLASTVASFSPSGQLQKYSLAYQVDNFASCADGGSVSVDTLGSVPPNLTGLAIGQDPFNANRQINSYIRKLAYYPVRLSNTNLVALTQG